MIDRLRQAAMNLREATSAKLETTVAFTRASYELDRAREHLDIMAAKDSNAMGLYLKRVSELNELIYEMGGAIRT